MTGAPARARIPTILVALLLGSTTLFAQTPPVAPADDARLKQLEQKLDQLLQQAAEIRQQLDQLRGAQPAAPAPVDDLTAVDTVPNAPAPPAAATQPASAPIAAVAAPAAAEAQVINNPSTTAASKVFNPDTSVIGNFLAHAGDRNPFENVAHGTGALPDPLEAGHPTGDLRAPATLDEMEVAFEAFVDPYAKAKVFLSITPEGAEIEEGYANFFALPKDLTAKAGKFKAAFGKANTWHTHQRPWADQPLVIHNFFGDEGLNDAGVSVTKIIANPANVYLDVTGEVLAGRSGIFHGEGGSQLLYVGHLKAYRDLTENANLEAGLSYARGTTPGLYDVAGTLESIAGERNQFEGIDLTYRWKPLSRGLYRSLILRTEAIANQRPSSRDLWGFYSSADYQFGQRWYTGVRVDRSAVPPFATATNLFDNVVDRGASATLSFWPSEFSQLRAQFRRTHYGHTDRTFNELLLQLQFSIGAHGAHTF
jgi:hypothetical protein